MPAFWRKALRMTPIFTEVGDKFRWWVYTYNNMHPGKIVMMKKTIFMLMFAVLAVLAGCSNPHDYKVLTLTDSERVELDKTLTSDEKRLLSAYVKRLEKNKTKLGQNITVREAITVQRDYKPMARNQSGISFAPTESSAMATKPTMLDHEELGKLMPITLVSKENISKDDGDTVVFTFSIQNNFPKTAKVMSGDVVFYDVDGDEILRHKIQYLGSIDPKRKVNYKVNIPVKLNVPINEVSDEDKMFWESEIESLDVKSNVYSVYFTDGTELQSKKRTN